MPAAARAEVFALLDRLGVPHRTHAHAPIFTVDEGRDLRAQLPGAHTKTLFLKDKKGRLALVTAHGDRRADLQGVAGRIGFGRVSFAKPPLLQEVLGVTPGSVTPFALINDRARRCAAVVDAALLDAETIYCHPLENTASTAIAPAGLLVFLEALGYAPHVVDVEAPGPPDA